MPTDIIRWRTLRSLTESDHTHFGPENFCPPGRVRVESLKGTVWNKKKPG